MICKNFKAPSELLLNNWAKTSKHIKSAALHSLEGRCINCVQIKKPQRDANLWPDIWALHLKVTTCKGDINISKQTERANLTTNGPSTVLQFL